MSFWDAARRREEAKVSRLLEEYGEEFGTIAEYLSGYAKNLKDKNPDTLYNFGEGVATYQCRKQETGVFECCAPNGFPNQFPYLAFAEALKKKIGEVANELECVETKRILEGFELTSVNINWQYKSSIDWRFSNEVAVEYLKGKQ